MKQARSISGISLLFVTTLLAGACAGGEQVEPDESSGGSGGETNDACPETPPNLTPAEECVAGLECSYSVDCQSGPADLTFTCTPDGSSVVQWRVKEDGCSFPHDTCPGTNVRCATGGNWVTQMPSDPPQPCPFECPSTKPDPGQATCVTCNTGCSICGGAVCGYPCANGDGWTVGTPVRAGSGCENGAWLFDGACAGDCSTEERALSDLANANKECSTAADCKIVRAECAFTKETCAGAFYVNASTDDAQWNRLAAALVACSEDPASGWDCLSCDAPDPPADCVAGRCVPGE